MKFVIITQNDSCRKILKLPLLSKNVQFFSKKIMFFEKKAFTLQRICVGDYFLVNSYQIMISQRKTEK